MGRHQDGSSSPATDRSPTLAACRDGWTDLGGGLALALHYEPRMQRWAVRFDVRGMGVTLMPLEQRDPHAVASALVEALELAALGCPPLVAPFAPFDPARPVVLLPCGEDGYRLWVPCRHCRGLSLALPTPAAPPVQGTRVRLLAARLLRALRAHGICLGCDARRIRNGQGPGHAMIWFDPDGGWELWWPGDARTPARSITLGMESLFADAAQIQAAAARALGQTLR